MLKNGTPASPAMARAKSVLPLPGGPRAITPSECAPRLLELLRVLEELDDFAQLLLGLVDTGHVGEGHLGPVLGQQLRSAAPERERLATACLQVAEDHEKDEDREHRRREEEQHGGRDAARVRRVFGATTLMLCARSAGR